MTITIDLPENYSTMLEETAKIKGVTKEEYSKEELTKALRNAAYIEKLKRAHRQVLEGKIITKTMEELEAMENLQRSLRGLING